LHKTIPYYLSLSFAVLLLVDGAEVARAQGLLSATKSSQPAALTDALGRQTPQSAMLGFLQACHARDYDRAAAYLDLRRLSTAQRHAQGEHLAQQLEDVLDDDGRFDPNHMSRSPEGDRGDGLAANLERIDSFEVKGRPIDLYLERVELQQGMQVWLFSSDSVAALPEVYKAQSESAFESRLPEPLVSWQFMGTPIWRLIALAILILVLVFVSSILSRLALALLRLVAARTKRLAGLGHLGLLAGPVRWIISVILFRAGMVFIGTSALLRVYMDRGLALIFFLAVAWLIARILDLVAHRLQSAMNARQRAVSSSVVPLGNRVIKVIVVLFAVTAILGSWGYNTTAILAGLGVGGIAIALAAQKTIENFFGGVSVISDRPVLVGDYCSFGNRSGTVEDIGLRSTRLRTPDRTLITVPNGEFSTMTIENFAKRDKIFFHPTLNLRRDTTAEQIREVLASVAEIFRANPKIEIGKMPVRFTGIGTYSLDIETNAYVLTADYDEFLRIQQDLLLKILGAVEQAGASLAVPTQASILSYRDGIGLPPAPENSPAGPVAAEIPKS